ncbi:MAG: TRAP transporter large permease [Burkholderiales bacterium]|jgi:tripartite ATP-independent transporter DctM subunit
MSPTLIAIGMFVVMLLMMAARLPIAAAMGVAGLLGFTLLAGLDPLLSALKGTTMARLSVYELSIIPLFLLMGQLTVKGGLSASLFRAIATCVGHLKGGLAFASVLSCAAFGSICGSSVATAATVTQVAFPEMKAHGYPDRLSTATLASGGTLGILIPPSVPLVIYAILAEQNIAKLFVAAIVPAMIAIAGYLLVIAILVRRPDAAVPLQPKASWRARRQALRSIWPLMSIFLAVFGGIYFGIMTPTEAAAVGVAGCGLAGLTHGTLGRHKIAAAVLATAETTAMIFFIFLGADLMNAGLALTQLPANIAQWIGAQTIAPLWILFGVLGLYLLLSSVMDELSMVILTIPVVYPIIMGLDLWGLNPQDQAIWFGILILMVVQFGLVAPPVGLNVMIVNSLAKPCLISETYRGVLPFLLTDLLRIIALIFFPVLSLWLVRAVYPTIG